MCGIAGTVNFNGKPASREIINAMSNSLIHRGPDQEGTFIDSNTALAHRRLSIIDLEQGRQPISNEDGSVWAVYNGEIYNFREIKAELQAKGHIFKTNCDSEIIVHLYEEDGQAFPAKLNGMFAMAVYDAKKKIMLLTRDRLGQKPLVYFKNGSSFAFASELQALKKHPDMPTMLRLQSVHDYLSLQYVPAPFTIYENVFKLPPASLMEINTATGDIKTGIYWKLNYSEKENIQYDEAKSKLRALIEDSVTKRLMSDVPYGVFLSGGIDSTIVTGTMAKICAEPVKAFTIGFDEALYDERKFANIAVNALNEITENNIRHISEIVKPDSFETAERLVKNYGEPFCDASMIPTYLLSKFTRSHVKTALSGDGADELFAGYKRYAVMRYAKYADFIPLRMREKILGMLSTLLPRGTEERSLAGTLHRLIKICESKPEKRYLTLLSRFDEEMKTNIYGERFNDFVPVSTQKIMEDSFRSATSGNQVEKIMETDLHNYLSGDILTKIDIASMAASLEVRSPFMDYRIAEFAATLPLKFKQHGHSGKHILKDAFRDILPEHLASRPKMGFGVPVAKWFRSKWDKPLRAHLLEGPAVKEGFFRKDSLEKLIVEHQSMKADHSYALWALTVFDIFLSDSGN